VCVDSSYNVPVFDNGHSYGQLTGERDTMFHY
jgi:hypothetical protein